MSMTKLPHPTLNLFFPQWQGSTRFEHYEGDQLLHKSLQSLIVFTQVPVSSSYSLEEKQNILGYQQIYAQLLAAKDVIRAQNPARILTIGGDCGSEITPVSFLNQQYSQELAIVWLGAHGDLNTPNSSPSGHFHGMPLRTLLGEGEPNILTQSFSNLSQSQIFLVRARDFDKPEESFIRAQELYLLTAEEVNDGNFWSLIERLQSSSFKRIYIHLDLDVIEPEVFPHVACPASSGLQIKPLRKLITILRKSHEIVGLSLLEFLPTGEKALAIAELLKLIHALNLPLLSISRTAQLEN